MKKKRSDLYINVKHGSISKFQKKKE